MQKEQLLQELKQQVDAGIINRADISSLFIENVQADTQKKNSSVNVVNVLYGIGGIVILSGVIALIAQNWDELNSFVRILVTLGMAVAVYASAVLLNSKNHQVLSEVLSAVSYVLFPLGIGVLMYEMDVQIEALQVSIILTALIILAVASFFLMKRGVTHLIFSVIFGTLAAYAYLGTVYSDFIMQSAKPYLYLTLALGISHGLLAYTLRQPHQKHSINVLGSYLYATGTFGLLVAALSLGGIWDVLFVFVVVGTFLLSVYLHSRGMLLWSSVFLIFYLFKITAEYFAQSVGWPIALILIGITTIVVAIGTFKVNQKYFAHAGQQLRSPQYHNTP